MSHLVNRDDYMELRQNSSDEKAEVAVTVPLSRPTGLENKERNFTQTVGFSK